MSAVPPDDGDADPDADLSDLAELNDPPEPPSS